MIWVEDTQIKVGNIVLPGLLKSLEVSTEAQIDEQEIEGSNKKKKQATGYGDGKITIELILEEGVYETAEYKLQKLQNLFREAGQEKPKVYNIISGHLASRNISKVIFKSLSSKEDNAKSAIMATLEFLEYEVMTVTAVKTATVNGTASVSSKQKQSPIATNDKKRSSSYQRGAAPKLSAAKKTSKSPAVDNTSKGKELSKKVRKVSKHRR
ncbi:MAG: hypothetical protein ACI4LO_01930 [Anaerovoracaceae bacterium]